MRLIIFISIDRQLIPGPITKRLDSHSSLRRRAVFFYITLAQAGPRERLGSYAEAAGGGGRVMNQANHVPGLALPADPGRKRPRRPRSRGDNRRPENSYSARRPRSSADKGGAPPAMPMSARARVSARAAGFLFSPLFRPTFSSLPARVSGFLPRGLAAFSLSKPRLLRKFARARRHRPRFSALRSGRNCAADGLLNSACADAGAG